MVKGLAAVVGAVAVWFVWLVIFMSYLSHAVQGLSRGWPNYFAFFFGGENRSPQHVPALPVSSRRKPSLLEEDAGEWISAVVCDGIRSCLAGAHSGG